MPKSGVNKINTFSGHKDSVYTIIPSLMPEKFYSGSGDGLVAEWNLRENQDGKLVAKVPNSVYSLCLLRNSNILVLGHNYDGIHLIDLLSLRETGSVKMTKSAIFDIGYYQDKIAVVSGDGVITVIDAKSLSVIARIEGSSKSARSVTFNQKNGEMCVGFSDHYIRIYDWDTCKMKNEWEAHKNSVFTVQYTPDYRYLLSGGRDAQLKIWDADNGYKGLNSIAAHLFAINHIAFSPDLRFFATCSLDKTIKIWDSAQFRLLKVIDKARFGGHGTSVNKLLWTDYNNWLISCSDDRTISIWDFNFIEQ